MRKSGFWKKDFYWITSFFNVKKRFNHQWTLSFNMLNKILIKQCFMYLHYTGITWLPWTIYRNTLVSLFHMIIWNFSADLFKYQGYKCCQAPHLCPTTYLNVHITYKNWNKHSFTYWTALLNHASLNCKLQV